MGNTSPILGKNAKTMEQLQVDPIRVIKTLKGSISSSKQ